MSAFAAAPDGPLDMDRAPKDATVQLLRSLAARIDAVLGALVPEGARCALVNYPNHWNTGDPAIWLGALAALERRRATVVYQCEWRTYNAGALANAVGDGPILITGGGNLGDLWLNPQRFRERVLRDFPVNPIIQLPQSIWYERPENAASFRALAERHADFTLLVRDAESLARARNLFDVETVLCPDMAFALGDIPRPGPATTRVFWLARSDTESQGYRVPPSDGELECRDWIALADGEREWLDAHAALLRRNAELTRLMQHDTHAARRSAAEVAETYRPLAALRLARGSRLLARGRAVITDRLHGHILCTAMQIPHVLLDNSYGKVRSTYETWTSAGPLAEWCDAPDRALERARSLADRRSPKEARFPA